MIVNIKKFYEEFQLNIILNKENFYEKFYCYCNFSTDFRRIQIKIIFGKAAVSQYEDEVQKFQYCRHTEVSSLYVYNVYIMRGLSSLALSDMKFIDRLTKILNLT